MPQQSRRSVIAQRTRIYIAVAIIVIAGAGLSAGSLFKAMTAAWEPSLPAGGRAIGEDGRAEDRGGLARPARKLGAGFNALYLAPAFVGAAAARQALAQNLVQPLALASADFDEDGVPDLAGGYGGPQGGVLALYRGNVDAIYPYTPEAQQRRGAAKDYEPAPFLAAAHVFELPSAPDFVGAGDFDADGHFDLMIAARGGGALYLLAGDGRGQFGAAQEIALPGRVTALVVGEINRADGLADVAVGVISGEAQVLVFEGPEGAWRATPETVALTSEVGDLALGLLDGDHLFDLAAATGRELIVVAGRDRGLSLDEVQQAAVPAATLSRHYLPRAVKTIVAGGFTAPRQIAALAEDGAIYVIGQARTPQTRRQAAWHSKRFGAQTEPAATKLITARVSGQPHDDLIALDAAGKLHVLAASNKSEVTARRAAALEMEGTPLAALPMRLNGDALSDLVVLTGGRTVPMVIASSPAATFIVDSTLDTANQQPNGICAVVSSGMTICTLREAIMEANATPAADTINFNIPAGQPRTITIGSSGLPDIIYPVTINGTSQAAPDGSPTIELRRSGSTGAAFGEAGLRILNGGSGTTISGLVINGFFGHGIHLRSSNNVIEGNFIGTDLTGLLPRGNSESGVSIDSSDTPLGAFSANNNLIGGTAAAARNVISANGIGVIIDGERSTADSAIMQFVASPASAIGNRIEGNTIGATRTGGVEQEAGNQNGGVVIASASNNTVGGTAAGARNVIVHNGIGSEGGGNGVVVSASFPNNSAAGNLVQGNLIGTNEAGVDLGNSPRGVLLDFAESTTVGGTVASARNVIAGNEYEGVYVNFANGTTLQGNFIGLNPAGTADLANGFGGVYVTSAAGTIIGGSTTGARNVISGNNGDGIGLWERVTTGTLIRGNFIGTQANGTSPLRNTGSGVVIRNFAENNQIGGTGPGEGNVIAFNSPNGVFLESGTGNSVRGNSIFSNTGAFGLGIDLGGNGVTQNDPGDGDGGPNNLQNFPIFEALNRATGTTIDGTLNSTPNTAFRIEFFSNQTCDPSGNGEGESFLSAVNVATNANGVATIATTITPALPVGRFITATATDPNGNTSEFSRCAQARTAMANLTITKTDAPDPVLVGAPLTYTITVSNAGPDQARNVTVTDPLPPSVTFVSVQTTQGSCTPPAVGGTGTLTCMFGNLAPTVTGQVPPATITLVVRPTTAGNISNTATVTSSEISPTPSNPALTTVNRANVQILSTLTPTTLVAGQPATLSATVSGPSPGLGVPTGTVTFRNCLPNGDCNQSTAVTLGTAPLNSQGQAMLPNIAFNAGLVYLSATYNGDAVFNSSNEFPANIVPANRAFIVGQAATTTMLASSLNPSPLGQAVTFTATVNVTAPGAGTPTGTVTFRDGTTVIGTAALNQARQATLTTATLADGARAITATYAGDNNFTSSTSTTLNQVVIAVTDLAVTKNDMPDPVLVNGELTYSITVTNNGPSTATNVRLEDTLTGGLVAPVRLSTSRPQGICVPQVTTAPPGITVNCNIGTLEVRETVTATIIVRPLTPGLLTNTVTARGTESDSNPGNDTVVVTTLVQEIANLTITKTLTTLQPGPGDELRYTIQVNNAGPGVAATVTLTDDLPANTVFRSLDVAGAWNCLTPAVGSSGTVTCQTATLPVNAPVTFTLALTVNNNVPPGTIINNRANVTSPTPDSDPTNNTAFAAEARIGAPQPLPPGDVVVGPITALPAPSGDPITNIFVIGNTGNATLFLTPTSLLRTFPDASRLTTPGDDRSLFNVSLITPGSPPQPLLFTPNGVVAVPAGSALSFRVVFNPIIPIRACRNTGLAANQALPETINSQLTLLTQTGAEVRVNLVGRIAPAARLVHPLDARRDPQVTLAQSGRNLKVEYWVYDPNMNVYLARYQFLNSGGQPVGDAVDVNVEQDIAGANLVRGQIFGLEQNFETGAQVGSVRVTIFDRDGAVVSANSGPGGPTDCSIGTVSAASFTESGLSAESIVSGFGTNFSLGTQGATTSPLPTQLAGTSIKIRDGAGIERLAPLFYVSPGQLNYQIPEGTSPGAATVAVTRGNDTLALGTVRVTEVWPGLFSADGNGAGVAAAVALRVKPDGTQSYEPVARFDPALQRHVAVPINLSEPQDQVFLLLYGTGLRQRRTLNDVQVRIGGVEVPVLYAGAQGELAGLDQVNIALPPGPSDEVEVVLTVEGQRSNPVLINIDATAGTTARRALPAFVRPIDSPVTTVNTSRAVIVLPTLRFAPAEYGQAAPADKPRNPKF